MTASEGVFFVPEMSGDERLRVFRRNFAMMDGFEGMEVDAYVLVSDHYVIVFDTMLCPEDAATMMQTVQGELPGRQVLVVNSHADWDHSWGNAYFTGEHAAPIIAHEYGLLRQQSEAMSQELTDFQNRYPIFRSVVLTPPTITFTHDLTIHDGNLTIELIAALGHQPDHIAAWLPQTRLLLAFDAVETPLPCIESAIYVPQMFATLENLLVLQPERVLCSHGKTTSPAIIKENLAYLREIEQRCRTLLSTHQPNESELEHGSVLIEYSLDDVVAGKTEPADRTFYSQAHENNIRYVLQWLMSEN